MYTEAQLSKDVSTLMSHAPYLEPLLFMVPMRVDDKVPTAYCSKKELVFGAQFMAGLSPAQRLGVIVHECQHGLLCHMSSDFVDTSLSPSRFAVLRNIAMDYVVERGVVEVSIASGGVVQSARGAAYLKKMREFGGASYIEVYKQLKDSPALAAGEWADAHFVDPAGADEAQELAQVVTEAMQAIKDKCEAGMVRGAGEVALGVGQATKVDWRARLRSMLHDVKTEDGRTWRSVNLRALLCFGQWQPARKQVEQRLHNVRILLDTSGSMGGVLADAVQDIAQVLSQVACENAQVRYYGGGLLDRVDTVVDGGQAVTNVALMRSVPNGGGTCVITALHELAEQDARDGGFEGVTICVTDGEDDLDVARCAVRPDFWVVYGGAVPPNAPYVRIEG